MHSPLFIIALQLGGSLLKVCLRVGSCRVNLAQKQVRLFLESWRFVALRPQHVAAICQVLSNRASSRRRTSSDLLGQTVSRTDNFLRFPSSSTICRADRTTGLCQKYTLANLVASTYYKQVRSYTLARGSVWEKPTSSKTATLATHPQLSRCHRTHTVLVVCLSTLDMTDMCSHSRTIRAVSAKSVKSFYSVWLVKARTTFTLLKVNVRMQVDL